MVNPSRALQALKRIIWRHNTHHVTDGRRSEAESAVKQHYEKKNLDSRKVETAVIKGPSSVVNWQDSWSFRAIPKGLWDLFLKGCTLTKNPDRLSTGAMDTRRSMSPWTLRTRMGNT